MVLRNDIVFPIIELMIFLMLVVYKSIIGPHSYSRRFLQVQVQRSSSKVKIKFKLKLKNFFSEKIFSQFFFQKLFLNFFPYPKISSGGGENDFWKRREILP